MHQEGYESVTTLRQYLNLTNPEYEGYVNDHWLKQTPPDRVVQNVLAGLLFVISVPSQICQLLVIVVYLRYIIILIICMNFASKPIIAFLPFSELAVYAQALTSCF